MKSQLLYRLVGTVACMLVGWQVGSLVGSGSAQPRNAVLGIAIGAILGLATAPFLVEAPYRGIRRVVGHMPVDDLLAAVVGLILGLVVAALLSYPLSFLPWWLGHFLPVATAVLCGYLGITLFLLRRRDLARMVPWRSASRVEEVRGGTVAPGASPVPPSMQFLVDTSAIIDGRIADVCRTGFLRGSLLVPNFVLRELQNVADSPDANRRSRGRRGLEILKAMQKDATTPVIISDVDVREVPDVDGKLVKLAVQTGHPILTNDFNLNRIAELQGVTVLNVNQLANALRPAVLPGEEMAVRIIQEGKESNQGVAYLDDGTMIVVENGRRYMDGQVEVVVTRVLQTVAGKMIFAQIKQNGHV